MDIADISMYMSQQQTLTDVGTAMLSKALDTSQVMGSELVSAIEASAMAASVQPYLGGNIDISL